MRRRRRRSMFATNRPRRTGVAWLEPGRRRRRGSGGGRVVAVAALVVLVGGGVAAAIVVLRNRDRSDARRAVAQRFVAAWTRGDQPAMWRQLDTHARATFPLARFKRLYRTADRAASIEQVRTGQVVGPRDGQVAVPVAVATRLFGTLRGTIALPVHDEGDGSWIRWTPHLRLPGLRAGEQVRRLVLATPRRASLLGADGRVLGLDPATAAVAGHAPAGRDRGSGLQRYYDSRLGGRPGMQLRFGQRVIARVPSRRGRSVHATIRPGLQRAAAVALGGRLGGVAALRPRDGAVLALAGLAVSAPQPPGSTFKIITLSGALQAGIATPSSSYPIRTSSTLSGVTLRNANDEACGGTLTRAFADSCNSVFAPLGAKLGARRLVRMAEAFGFNDPPRVPDAKVNSMPPAGKLKDAIAVGSSAIGQDRDLATPLGMAAVAATIGTRGMHARPRIATSDPVQRRRAVSARVAAQVRSMMLGVVSSGTGTAAALPGVQVAGKTGTAELRSTVGGPSDPKNTDAWFVAFAPARKPTVAVAVMLVGAGAGGKAAAPIARQVLVAALGR